MIKFLSIFALVALVACTASAGPIAEDMDEELSQSAMEQMSQAPLFPNPIGETEQMPEHLKPMFSDFCLRASDKIHSHVKQSTDEASVKVINIFMNSVANIASDALKEGIKLKNDENHAKERELPLSADKDKDGKVSETELKEQIDEEIGRQLENVEQSAKPGFVRKFTIALFNALRSIAIQQLNGFTKDLNMKNMGNMADKLDTVCFEMNQKVFLPIEKMFLAEKASLQKVASDRDAKDLLTKTQIGDLKCVTIGRMQYFQQACTIARKTSSILSTISLATSGSN